jgi:hypothetical protein
VSTLAVPVPRPSTQDEPPLPDGELSLADLLDLFGLEEAAEPAEPVAAARPAATARIGLRARLQAWVEQAAGWGSGPQGTWRAW